MEEEQQQMDLYALLGVTKNSSDAEIKKSYHKLAKEFHPDKNPEAGDKFKEISFAYEVLSNPEKREIYDRYGLKGLQEGGDTGYDASEFFSNFFPFNNSRGQSKVKPIIQKVEVTLEEIYVGNVTKTVTYKRLEHCPECDGNGGQRDAVQKCEKCRGTGRVTGVFMGVGAFESMCPNCEGRGNVFPEDKRCLACQGQGLIEVENTVDIILEKGAPNMYKFPFHSEGNQNIQGDRGDLIVVIVTADHPTFLRRQNDLYLRDVNISLTEALCGLKRCFKHLDGRFICISSPAEEVLHPGCVRKISGEGMPIYGNPVECGDLLVQFQVDFPENNFATAEQMALLESVLPPREPFVMPIEPEEVQLVDPLPYGEDSRGAYGGHDDDDDYDGAHVGGVQCQTA